MVGVTCSKRPISNGRIHDSAFTAALCGEISSAQSLQPLSNIQLITMAQQQITAKKQQGSSGANHLPDLESVADFRLKSCNYSIQAIRTAFSRLPKRLVTSSRRRKNISRPPVSCNQEASKIAHHCDMVKSMRATHRLFHMLTATLLLA